MRKSVKIIVAIVMILITVLLISNTYATPIQPGDLKAKPLPGIENPAGTVIGIFQTAGTIIAVVIVIWVGIQYLIASTEQKAEYKTKMIAYLVGAVFVFMGPTIVQILYNAIHNMDFGA